MVTKPRLLAAYWNPAGDVYPGAPTEVSPFSLEARAAAAARVSYTGMCCPAPGSSTGRRSLRAGHAAGCDAPYYGVEIISVAFRTQPLEVMARTSFEATMRQVELVGLQQARATQ